MRLYDALLRAGILPRGCPTSRDVRASDIDTDGRDLGQVMYGRCETMDLIWLPTGWPDQVKEDPQRPGLIGSGLWYKHWMGRLRISRLVRVPRRSE